MELADPGGTEPGDLEQFQQARRDLPLELLQVLRSPGLEPLADDGERGGPDPADSGERAIG